MLLILFWISFLIYNVSYLFSVLFLASMIMLLMLFFFSNMIYLKYLVVLVYVSGVVIFILYISCMCWNSNSRLSIFFIFFSLFVMFLYDSGISNKIFDVGEYLWMFFFFSLMFSSLVNMYSLILFKVTGSLRF